MSATNKGLSNKEVNLYFENDTKVSINLEFEDNIVISHLMRDDGKYSIASEVYCTIDEVKEYIIGLQEVLNYIEREKGYNEKGKE